MARFLNLAAYKFAELGNLEQLRQELRAECRERGLKGSILLSPEGINFFVAGESAVVEWLLETLRRVSGLEDLKPKVSKSAEQPFNRMLVKIKREIIAFGVPTINPARYTSPKIAPRELKRWLDEARSIILLDTRNEYEIKLGSFAGAFTLGIRHFRHFPEAIRRLPLEMREKDTPIVTFCTGGIRCEKAAPLMEREGFRNVLQLDGGILNYFQECGGAHYEGECFVFDKRVGVDPSLRETGSQLCFACQEPLKPEELLDSRYVYEKSCPRCFEGD